ncbi:MAG: nickel insertion protein, partial [Pseudonocardiales bacterium]
MILWLNPTAGLSGDMLLGALLDLGAPMDAVRAAIASTGVEGWSVEPIAVHRQGIRALHARVAVTDSVSERSAADLIELVGGAQPELVAAVARAAVLSLAEVEAGIHGVPI